MTDERIPLSIEDILAAVRMRQGFDKGRRLAHAQARRDAIPNETAVRRAWDHDVLAGLPERGRAARIARATNIEPRTVSRILGRLLLRVPNSSR